MGTRAFEGETGADQQPQRPEPVLPASATQHLLALQRTAGNRAVARLLVPAAPRTARQTTILPNPVAANAAVGHRALGRILARKRSREQVEETLRSDVYRPEIENVVVARLRSEASKQRIPFDEASARARPFDEKIAIVLADSEASYNASLKRGEWLLKIVEKYAEVIASPTEGMKELRQPKELRKEHAAAMEKGFNTKVVQHGWRLGTTEVKSETPSFDEHYEVIVDVPNKTFTADDILRTSGSSLPHFSEVLWWQYKKAVALHTSGAAREEYRKAKSESLAQIWQKTIINSQTLGTMLWCDGAPTRQDEWVEVHPSVEAERKDFCALLGTPNGLSAAHLLVEHGARFGKTAINSIEYTTWPGRVSNVLAAHMRIHFS